MTSWIGLSTTSSATMPTASVRPRMATTRIASSSSISAMKAISARWPTTSRHTSSLVQVVSLISTGAMCVAGRGLRGQERARADVIGANWAFLDPPVCASGANHPPGSHPGGIVRQGFTMGESLAGAVAEVARHLADGGDVVGGLQLLVERTAENIDSSDAWVFLGAGPRQRLLVVNAEAEGLPPIPEGDGPCSEAIREGGEILCSEPGVMATRWGEAGRALLDAGYAAIHALPLGVNGEVVGSLLVARTEPRPLDDDELEAARAMAALASVGLSLHRSEEVAAQLQHALDARVAVEQAKGVVSATLQLPVSDAFQVLRQYARDRNLKLIDLASSVVDGEVRPEELAIDLR
jgi:GAF domain-containing protein